MVNAIFEQPLFAKVSDSVEEVKSIVKYVMPFAVTGLVFWWGSEQALLQPAETIAFTVSYVLMGGKYLCISLAAISAIRLINPNFPRAGGDRPEQPNNLSFPIEQRDTQQLLILKDSGKLEKDISIILDLVKKEEIDWNELKLIATIVDEIESLSKVHELATVIQLFSESAGIDLETSSKICNLRLQRDEVQ
jgi:hypothetical protein